MQCVYGEHKIFEGRYFVKEKGKGNNAIKVTCNGCNKVIDLRLIKQKSKTADGVVFEKTV